jgi:hypothetical protein
VLVDRSCLFINSIAAQSHIFQWLSLQHLGLEANGRQLSYNQTALSIL